MSNTASAEDAETRRRNGMRLLRAAPLFGLSELAARVGERPSTLRGWARASDTRGVCAQIAAGSRGGAALWVCPPPHRRTAGVAVSGTSGWAARGSAVSTPGAELWKLLSDTLNPAAPAAFLRRLAAADDVLVRAEAARHRDLPAATLIAAANRDPKAAVRAAAIDNPSWPSSMLAAAAQDDSDLVRASVAAKTRDPNQLWRLVGDKQDVRAAVAANPASLPDLIWHLAIDQDPDVRASAGRNPSCPPEALQHLAGDSFTPREAATANPNCPPEVLLAAYRGEIPSRRGLAANPACPLDLLTLLAGSGVVEIRAAAVGNPSCPSQALRQTVRDCPEVCSAAAGNPNCPPEVLEQLAGSEHAKVREAVASNPAAPAAQLALLAHDAYIAVRTSAAGNPNCPPADLVRIAGGGDEIAAAATIRSLATAGLSRHRPAAIA